jgi:ribonuclease D
MDKRQQSSDWAAPQLSQAQQEYAASDVYNLHAMKDKLTEMLVREDRMDVAQRCFDFLPTRADLDLMGWGENDIFAHK